MQNIFIIVKEKNKIDKFQLIEKYVVICKWYIFSPIVSFKCYIRITSFQYFKSC